jgi:hypothetical protein
MRKERGRLLKKADDDKNFKIVAGKDKTRKTSRASEKKNH